MNVNSTYCPPSLQNAECGKNMKPGHCGCIAPSNIQKFEITEDTVEIAQNQSTEQNTTDKESKTFSLPLLASFDPQDFSIEGLEPKIETLSKELEDSFGRFAFMNGISRDPEIELGISPNQNVYVKSPHPDKERIEDFFANNEYARSKINELSSKTQMLDSIKESLEFQRRYAVDPKAAVEEFSHLFNDSYKRTTTVKINTDGVDYEVKGSVTV
ncbi:MAG: hypothetical protein PHF29_03835 [Candidatus Riflebacteria bacterium]|nr:hypothetical protein [Candidatus Riflebacteria bacterium]